ncbi:hypothetical protein ABAC460_14345 [Asticcacaulis sp. AC460]|uniref:SCO4402 family protein n=1 Tax=Asticcacaulis sp. AC460 TaxID=1282360 RepID=UPI0003C3C491|nr:hypothetical protein [Asticcacaulis sp. AC460]ESQ88957.1 hypothetical protein ABAC460_14345 [Asticcacaulis sp. AC460]
MTGQYPDSWASLRFPNQRAELVFYLRDCCDPHHYLDSDEVHFDVHFFFDDHDFADDPMGMIGAVLFDDVEVAAMTRLVRAYKAAIGPGQRMPDVGHIDWAAVVEAAKAAYALILQRGEPVPVPGG